MSKHASNTRRTFIRNSATGVFLFDIVPSRALGLQGQAPPSDTLNFGHIGIGGRGRRFVRPEAGVTKSIPASTNLGGDGSRILRPARRCRSRAVHCRALKCRIAGVSIESAASGQRTPITRSPGTQRSRNTPFIAYLFAVK